MDKKKICFIAQFPPPMHGLSKAVETLYNSELNTKIVPEGKFIFNKISITDSRCFLKNLGQIGKSKADLFYFTISQTKAGNLRDLIILKLLALQKKKCLIHLHGGYYRELVDNDLSGWQKRANYKAIERLDGVIVLSDSLKRIFRGMLPEKKIYVVMNCVDDEYLLSNEEASEKWEELKTKKIFHVLYLSNFIRTKGYPKVLEMAKIEKERVAREGVRKFHFDFAGHFFEEKERIFFFDFVRENGLEEYITYHGTVDKREKKELLKYCDIFVLLTNYPNEGQPISILEAMGNGMMIVTTNHAGIPDIVKNGVHGIVVDGETSSEDVLKLISTQTNRLPEFMKINRLEITNKFQQKGYLERMRAIYKDI